MYRPAWRFATAGALWRGTCLCHEVLLSEDMTEAHDVPCCACRRVVEGDRFIRAGKFRGWLPTLFVGQLLQARRHCCSPAMLRVLCLPRRPCWENELLRAPVQLAAHTQLDTAALGRGGCTLCRARRWGLWGRGG